MNAGKGFQSAYKQSYPVGKSVLRKAEMRWSADAPLSYIRSELGSDPLALVILLVTPQANFENGLLEISVPKSAKTLPRKIEINSAK